MIIWSDALILYSSSQSEISEVTHRHYRLEIQILRSHPSLLSQKSVFLQALQLILLHTKF